MIRYSSDLESKSIAQLEDLHEKFVTELIDIDEKANPDYALFLKQTATIIDAWLDYRKTERAAQYAFERLKKDHDKFNSTIEFRGRVFKQEAT